jgi:RHS repeat-associated protein
MGYLGAQERRADPMSGLIQMGARSYDPQLGAFLSEDVVYGHIGTGTSFDRYAYAWDNPVNLYDLDGRFPSPSDIGDAVGGTVQDLGNAGGDLASQVGDEFSDAGRWTAGAGRWVGDRASDFWKVAGDYALACLKNGAWGAGLGAGLGVAGGGAGAAPGAIIGGLSGCGQGLLQEGLRKSGHDRAAEVIEVVGAGKDVRHGVNVFRKTAPPELIERLKELPHVFF